MTDEEKSSSNVEDELKSIKDEMKELKEMLKKKAKEEAEEDINVGSGTNKRKHSGFMGNFKIEMDDDDFQFEGVDETLENYLGSVMEGVASNLSNSMKQMAQGFQFNIDLGGVKREIEKNKHHIEREVRRAEREARRAEREVRRAARDIKRGFSGNHSTVIKFHKLSEEELESFYEKAPDLTSALSDSKKLKLLKTLENGPMYQKDLSETTSIAGGTFKHHMDALMEVKYVQQEAVRGRYLITQLGVEALKLSEMLFRRFIFVTEETAQEREQEVDVEMEEEINHDISTDEDAVNNLQNEEEEE